MHLPRAGLLAAVCAGLTGCQTDRRIVQDEAPARAAGLERLIVAVCLPYVVDGAPEAQVVSGAKLHRYYVHPGIISDPGRGYFLYRDPSPAHASIGLGNGGCTIRLRGSYSDLYRKAVDAAVTRRGSDAYEARPWSRDWPGVLESPDPPSKALYCVRGRTPARIVVSTPRFASQVKEFDVAVYEDRSGRFYCPGA